jgi:hypothetical protein
MKTLDDELKEILRNNKNIYGLADEHFIGELEAIAKLKHLIVQQSLPTADELNYAFTAIGHGGSIENPSSWTCHQATSERVIELIRERRNANTR